MKVSFGVSLSPGTPLLHEKDKQRFMDLAKMADDYGAEAIGTYDTAFIGGDAYVRTTLLALASSRARVGLRPTNPLTREPQVMASFLASIDSLTGGRAFMDIASGDSGVLNIGLRVASRARIEDYVRCVRDLIAKGEGAYQGRSQRVRWSSTAVRPRVPISICAEGPKMLHLGGRIGDGVIAGTGLLPEVIQGTIARIQAGAREAGLGLLDPEPLDALRPRGQARAGGPEVEDPDLRRRLRALRPRAPGRAEPQVDGPARADPVRPRALRPRRRRARLDRPHRADRPGGRPQDLGQPPRGQHGPPDALHAHPGRADHVALRVGRAVSDRGAARCPLCGPGARSPAASARRGRVPGSRAGRSRRRDRLRSGEAPA
ncbi:MAG: hypothetical protein DME10_25765 [Candidatus Rokuibacteriota bacterium]|nr:MAG: hypothetical protein DME10_25765 [Candidatus Rokubacteria bacterium]